MASILETLSLDPETESMTDAELNAYLENARQLLSNIQVNEQPFRPPTETPSSDDALGAVGGSSINTHPYVVLPTFFSKKSVQKPPARKEGTKSSEFKRSTSNSAEPPKCGICYDTFDSIKDVRGLVSTVCGHVFCDTCMGHEYFKRSGPICPNCRQPLRKEDYHPLYLYW